MEKKIKGFFVLFNIKLTLSVPLVFCYLCALNIINGQTLDDDTVDLVQGTLRGSSRILDGRRVYYFLGVPYAEPPLNNRRFRPSSPHNGWTGTYIARDFKPVCPQPTGNAVIRDQMSEDCLYINVWTPFLPRRGDSSQSRRPVIVFIEGMLYLLSNPRDYPVDDMVSEEDVVVVTLSYRVNAFGFFCYEDPLMPGNLGLRDQQLALLWVSENIDNFGGDPNSITLMGHSAGAASVMYHLISERSRLYIQRAALMSGSVLAPWAFQVNAKANARILANNLRCFDTNAAALLQCLQNKPMLDIVSEVNRMVQNGNTSALFAPVNEYDWVSSDQIFMGKDPLTALKRGDFKRVPMVTGVMTEEGVLMGYFLKENLNRLNVREISFFVMNSVIPAVIRQIPSLSSQSIYPTDFVRDVISYGYFGDVSSLRSDGIQSGVIQDNIANNANLDERDRSRMYNEIVAFFTDVYFVAPLEKQNRLVSIANGGVSGNVGQSPIYFYSNDFRSEDIFGNTLLNRSSPSHGSDLLYLFGPLMYRRFFGRDFQSFSEERQSRTLKQLFSDFVYGNFPGNLQWRPYTLLDRYYYEVDRAIEGRRYKGERAYNFWEVYLPNLVEQVNSVNSTLIQEQLIIYTAFTYIFLVILIIIIITLICLCCLMKQRGSGRASKKPRKESQTRFQEPLETQFDAGDSIFTVEGQNRSKSAIPIGGSSYRSPNAPSLQPSSTSKSPVNSGYVNTGYSRGDPSIPQPTGKSRGYGEDSRDSGMNSGLSDYMSKMDPGRLSSRRWRESVTDYRNYRT